MHANEMLWSFALLPDDYVVLDTETTGLFDEVGAPGVVSVGLVKVVGREQVDGREFRIRPYRSVSEEAFSVHGIEDDELKGCPTFGDLWEEISLWLEGNLIVMHNAAFDWRLMLDHIARYGKSPVEVKGVFCSQKSAFPWAEVCGIPLSSRGPSLDTLTAYFQIESLREVAGRHGALLDAKQTASLIEAMRNFACAPKTAP